MTRYQRPGRRPGFKSWRRDALPALAFVFVCGLFVTRWVTGVSLLDAAQTVEEEKHVLETIEREVDRERMEVEQAIAIARIEPRARAAGLDRVEAEAVMLLAAGGFPRVPAARPLGAPGAGARGSWFHRVWGAARVAAAAAAVEAEEKAVRTPRGKAAPRFVGPVAAHAAGQVSAAHTAPVGRCDICRARAAGRKVSH